MIDERFIGQIGTEKQHKYICFLASKLGHDTLRYVVADWAGCSPSKAGRITFTVKDASSIISWLQSKAEE